VILGLYNRVDRDAIDNEVGNTKSDRWTSDIGFQQILRPACLQWT